MCLVLFSSYNDMKENYFIVNHSSKLSHDISALLLKLRNSLASGSIVKRGAFGGN